MDLSSTSDRKVTPAYILYHSHTCLRLNLTKEGKIFKFYAKPNLSELNVILRINLLYETKTLIAKNVQYQNNI